MTKGTGMKDWAVMLVCAVPILTLLMRLTKARNFRQRFDRVRMGSPNGATFEAIDPPWWNIPRQLLKLRADGEIEFMYPHPLTHNPQYIKVKAREIQNPSDICPLCKRPFKRRLP